jgi:SAM-dependent methyltransferase
MSGTGETDFDEYASDYDAALARGVSVSGEDKDYFAQGRVAWLSRRLAELGQRPGAVMDFGCGTGSAAPFLMRMPGIDSLVGVDVSARSVERARQMHAATGARFLLASEHRPEGTIDLAFCNGVFHHIPPAARASALDYIARAVRPGGFFAFWENNPWNPGTCLVMRRIPFDRDAKCLSPPHARRLLTRAGFNVLRTDFLFFFPRALSALRPLESRLAGFPAGAQYMVLCRKGR